MYPKIITQDIFSCKKSVSVVNYFEWYNESLLNVASPLVALRSDVILGGWYCLILAFRIWQLPAGCTFDLTCSNTVCIHRCYHSIVKLLMPHYMMFIQ